MGSGGLYSWVCGSRMAWRNLEEKPSCALCSGRKPDGPRATTAKRSLCPWLICHREGTRSGARNGTVSLPHAHGLTPIELSPGWYHLRTPVKKEYSLTLRPGHLALYGNMYTIQSKECPAMLLRKQTSLTGTWETSLEFEPENEYEEAGTAVYLLGASYIAMLIRQKAGVRQIVLQWIDEQHTLKVSTVAAFVAYRTRRCLAL